MRRTRASGQAFPFRPSADLLKALDDPIYGVMVVPNRGALTIQCREGPE